MTKREIDEFLAQKTLAIVGVSRGGKKFGNMVLRDLTTIGYRLMPIHPEAAEVGGVKAFPSFAALPEPVGGVIVVVPPAQAAAVVQEAAAHGIRRVWLQQGAESPEAIELGRQLGLSVVAGECIMMFAAPVGFPHGMHRWLWKVLGKLPR